VPKELPYNRNVKSLARIVAIIGLCAIGGCAVAPSEDDIRAAITDYYCRQHYRVVDLKIGRIEGVALFEKTYMGTPGYTVEIPSITLEAQQDKGSDIKKGTRLNFSDARIRMMQDRENKSLWHVSIISGIAVY
jgi:hypothetical protein